MSVSSRIVSWVEESTGWFSIWQIDESLGIIGPHDKNIRRVILHTLFKVGKLKRITSGTKRLYCLATLKKVATPKATTLLRYPSTHRATTEMKGEG